MKKKILFRADGNSKTGLGHLYRLFALVEMYKEQYDFVFLTKEDSVLYVIPSEYRVKTIPCAIEIDKEPFWINTNFSPQEYIIIADGYQFVSRYQKAIKGLGFFLMYVDDLAEEYMYADIVVNHSLYINEEDFKAPLNTKFALGTQYAILRPSFLLEAKKGKKIKKIRNIFICFGGADFCDITNTCLKGVIDIENIENIHIVLGGAYKHRTIFETIKGYENKVFLHKNLSEVQMLNLMNMCQLGVVPTSTISYEVCSVKMLILGGYYIDNQINIYKGFQEKGMIYDAGNLKEISSKDFKKIIEKILKDSSNQYQEKIDKQKTFFDGNQKARFQQLLQKLG